MPLNKQTDRHCTSSCRVPGNRCTIQFKLNITVMMFQSLPLAITMSTLSAAALYWNVSVMKVFPEPEWECAGLPPPAGAPVRQPVSPRPCERVQHRSL